MDQNRISGNPKDKWILAFSIAFFAALGTNHSVFSLIGFAICLCVVATCANEDVLFVLVFCMSFAGIFKVSPSAQSLFTYILILYVGYQFFRGRSLGNEYGLTLVLLILFLAAQFLMSVDIFRTIKFVVNFLFVYFALYDGTGHEREIFYGYIGGVLCSSILAWCHFLPNLGIYVQNNNFTFVNSSYLIRFAGLYEDPNYYCINIIISLCLSVILYHRKEMKTVPFALISLTLFSFAILTYSKSAFVMLLVPVLMFLYANNKGGRYFLQMVCLLALLFFAIYALSGQIDFLAVVLSRFQKAENLNELTTGRFGIWKNYMKNCFQSFFHLLVGRGFGAKLVSGKAAHNTYIDFVYYLGLIGSFLITRLLYVTVMDFKSEQYQKNFLNYSVMTVILIMYFFLSELFYFDMPFHILLAMMVINMNISDFTKNVSTCKVKNRL